MSRRPTTTATPDASAVAADKAKRIEDLEDALHNVAALSSEFSDTLRAVCMGALSMIDGTSQSAVPVAELVMHLRDQLHVMDDAIAGECAAVGCAHVSRRMEEVLAQIDRAAASTIKPGGTPNDSL